MDNLVCFAFGVLLLYTFVSKTLLCLYSISDSAFYNYAVHHSNHMPLLQKCFGINQMDRLIDYMKTTNSSNFVQCDKPINHPAIESSSTKGAFLTQTPEEIYSSDKPPILDVMFGFNSKVFSKKAINYFFQLIVIL